MAMRKPDEAHRHADEVLDGLEAEIGGMFDESDAEMRGLLDERLSDYDGGRASGDKAWRGAQAAAAAAVALECSRIAQHATSRAGNASEAVLRDVCAEGVNVTAYRAELASGRPLFPKAIDQDTVDVLMQENGLLFHDPKPDGAKVRVWTDRRMSSALTQGIMNGESIPKIADRLNAVNVGNMAAALRAARTAVTGAENAGRVIGMNRAEAMGIRIRKRWLATLDIHTRDSHRHVDGETVEINEEFGNGLMFPGDPDGLPGEVYNCRCTMEGVVEEDQGGPRLSKLGDLSYEDWKAGKNDGAVDIWEMME